jgi:hypothetical protein
MRWDEALGEYRPETKRELLERLLLNFEARREMEYERPYDKRLESGEAFSIACSDIKGELTAMDHCGEEISHQDGEA